MIERFCDIIYPLYTRGVRIMAVCYNKLFKLLIDKNMKKTELAKATGMGQNTLAKLSKNQNVSMDVLIRICEVLNCNIGDIVDVVEENK